ncbi:hypothetical protein [Motilimonas sp. KMU-193]|uniref:hypothetical protein n=1 Tax=Motilimonas sp. KMU-193 TaxID=3388668 RepID=UPI00396B3034
MNYYQVNILLPEPADAARLYQLNPKRHGQYLSDVLAELFDCHNATGDQDINIEGFDCFTNELEINCLGSKFPMHELIEVVKPTQIDVSHGIKLTTFADGYREKNQYILDGKKTTAAKFKAFYQKHKVADPTVECLRLLEAYEFDKVYDYLPHVDYSRMTYGDNWRTCLINTHAHSDLLIHLVKHQVIPEFRNTRYDQGDDHFSQIITSGSVAALKYFIAAGYTTFTREPEMSVFNYALKACDDDGYRKMRLLLEHFPDQITSVTPNGSPLWQHPHLRMLCEYLQQHGAKVVAPQGFYDELSPKECALQAAQHNDITAFASCYQTDWHLEALKVALASQSGDIVEFLDNEQPIDWLENNLLQEYIAESCSLARNSPLIVAHIKERLKHLVKEKKRLKVDVDEALVKQFRSLESRLQRWLKKYQA